MQTFNLIYLLKLKQTIYRQAHEYEKKKKTYFLFKILIDFNREDERLSERAFFFFGHCFSVQKSGETSQINYLKKDRKEIRQDKR